MASKWNLGDMLELAKQRCFNHVRREAVARCTECKRFFCRECVTEHDDRLICASCLRADTAATAAPRKRFRVAARLALASASFLLLWFLFFVMGRTLLTLPSTYHEDIEAVHGSVVP